jgi:hypothetical protein
LNGTLLVVVGALAVTALMTGLAFRAASVTARKVDKAIAIAETKERRTGRCGVCDGSGHGAVGRNDTSARCWRCRGTGLPPASAVPWTGDA